MTAPQTAPDHAAWLRDDLMRGMPHFITTAWTPDQRLFDTEAIAEAWRRIGLRSVHILSKHETGPALYPARHRNDNLDRDFFGEQVEAYVKRDIRVSAYYCVGLDDWAGGMHPEWCVRDEHGQLADTTFWASPSWMCLSSPWRDFAIQELHEVAEYPISGFWLDILGLPVDPNLCFCDHCARAYSDYAGATNLINMRGSEEHWEFKMWSHKRFVEDARQVLRDHGRDPTVIFNGAGAPFFKRYAEPFDGSDSNSTECHNPVLMGAIGRLNRNSGNPFELLSCSEQSWVHTVLKPDTLVELEAFAAAAQGATYTVGFTVTPEGRFSPGNIDRMAAINAKLEEQRDLLRGATPIYDVGVVSSRDNREMREVIGNVWRWTDFMRQGHLLHNVLPGFHNLDAQRVVAIPAGITITPADRAALERYVRGGGNLIVEAPTRHEPGDGPYFLRELLGLTFQGRSQSDWHYIEPVDPTLRRDGMAADPILVPGPADTVQLDGAEQLGALIHEFVPHDLAHLIFLANPPHRDPPDQPGITLHRYGKGRVVFIAAQLSRRSPRDMTDPWAGTLAQNLAALLLDDRPIATIEAGTRVELVANRQDGRIIIHLLNHAYSPTPSLPSPDVRELQTAGIMPTSIHSRGVIDLTGPITVSLDSEMLGMSPTSARLVPGGEELALSPRGNRQLFEVPGLGVHQTIVLE